VQFVLAAEQENEPTAQPLPIRNPGQFVFIVSGSQPGSQVVFDGSTTASTPSDGGSVVPPSGTASYSIFSAVGGLFNLVGGASQAALGVNVVFASGAVTAITEGISSPLTVPLAIGGTVIVVHGLDQAWAGATTIWTGQTQRPYAAQALDPLTGNATASDVVNGGVGIALSGGAGALARGTQVAGQVASKGDEIATAVGTIAGRADDAVGVIDDAAGRVGAAPSNTVWDRVKPTQEVWPEAEIPRSFELTTQNGQRVWVHGNATEHLAERVVGANGPTLRIELGRIVQQSQLTSLEAAVSAATKNGIPYNQPIRVGGWELIFRPGRAAGDLPALVHALPLE
jgi:hypothetical protein